MESSNCSSTSPLASTSSSKNGFGVPTKADAAHNSIAEQPIMVIKTTKRIRVDLMVTCALANVAEMSSVRALNIRRTIASVWFVVVPIGTPRVKIPKVFGTAFGAISSSSLNLE